MSSPMSRRSLLRYLAGSAAASVVFGQEPRASAQLLFHSPRLTPFVDELPLLPTRSGAALQIAAHNDTHRFHRDLGLSPSFAYGGRNYLGPVLEAQSGVETRLIFDNDLGPHIFAKDIDTTLHGVTASDRSEPRTVLHLHGGVTPPRFDGHPEACVMPGESFTHRYPNRQEAACLWYHDHAMGLTRLNAYAGLAGLYILRDRWDTGRPGNPLGLPAGEYELPLVLQEKIFTKDGAQSMRSTSLVPQGKWEGGSIGDVGLANGKAWPEAQVDRGLYRIRLINAGSFSVWNLFFSNLMKFWVIGNDGGLLDAPVPTRSVRVAPAERVDLLVDFGQLEAGKSVVLCNKEPAPAQAAIIGEVPVPYFCRFRATSFRGFRGPVPTNLRGGANQPPRLAPLPKPTRVRNVTISQLFEARLPPALMSLNNLTFESDDIEQPRQGTVEQWNLINVTNDPHPVHIHLINMRVLGRQPITSLTYVRRNPRPKLGVRWAPSADPFATGVWTQRAAWEAGNKDTVLTLGNTITRVQIRWPTAAELGFDPDASFRAATHTGSQLLRGYVWHCHIFDHEDHDMMLRLRVPA